MDAAVSTLREGGSRALTQPRVARVAGVAQGHLTYYFPTRTDLWREVAEQSVRRIVAGLDAVVAAAPSDPADMAHMVAVPLLAAANDRVLVGLAMEADRDPHLRAAFSGLVSQVRERVRVLLGTLGVDADDELVAGVHAAGVGLAVLFLGLGEPAVAELEVALRTLLEAVVAGRSRDAGP